jgi:hypothetical protein
MQLTASDIDRISKMPMNFLVGKERSGTTLLQIMLNSHPNISGPPESRFIILLHRRYGSVTQWTEKKLTDFCNDLYREKLFANNWKLDKKFFLSALMPIKEHLTYPIICKCVLYLFSPNGKDVKILIDKNPIYYYFLPELEEIFPEAKFIHLVRDYRGNIASHKRIFRVKEAADLAYRWVKVDCLVEQSKKRKPGRYFTLTYESLVTDVEKRLQDLCHFLELPYSENMGKNHTEFLYPKFAENRRARFMEFHGNVLKPVTTALIEEWKQKLTAPEITEAEAIAGKYAEEKYGYALTKPVVKINAVNLLIIKVKYRIIKTIYRLVFKRFKLYFFVRREIWNDF